MFLHCNVIEVFQYVSFHYFIVLTLGSFVIVLRYPPVSPLYVSIIKSFKSNIPPNRGLLGPPKGGHGGKSPVNLVFKQPLLHFE